MGGSGSLMELLNHSHDHLQRCNCVLDSSCAAEFMLVKVEPDKVNHA